MHPFNTGWSPSNGAIVGATEGKARALGFSLGPLPTLLQAANIAQVPRGRREAVVVDVPGEVSDTECIGRYRID